jgi:hypothetical protein
VRSLQPIGRPVSIEKVLKHWEVEHALREFAVSVKAPIETQARDPGE